MSTAGTLRQHIFIVSFLYSLQTGVLLFFNSTALYERGFSDSAIGILVAIGYVLALILTFFIPFALRKCGDRHVLTASLVVTGLSYLGIALIPGPFAAALLIPLSLALMTDIYVLIDIFLTTVSGNIHKVAGRRGLYITIVHAGIILAQLFGMFVLATGSLNSLYAIVGIGIIILAAISHTLLKDFRDAHYTKADWPKIFHNLSKSPNLRNTFMVQFILRLFYGLMVIFTPVYLLEHVGIPLESLGFVFAFMLLPFVILEIPVGRLEDSIWHEREVLITGFALAALTTAALAFITSSSVVVWALALFATRVGAALIEIGGEAYFFKHVHGKDAGEMSAYRMLSPLSHIVGPLLAVIFLAFLPFQYLFIALAVVLLFGILFSSLLKD